MESILIVWLFFYKQTGSSLCTLKANDTAFHVYFSLTFFLNNEKTFVTATPYVDGIENRDGALFKLQIVDFHLYVPIVICIFSFFTIRLRNDWFIL